MVLGEVDTPVDKLVIRSASTAVIKRRVPGMSISTKGCVVLTKGCADKRLSTISFSENARSM